MAITVNLVIKLTWIKKNLLYWYFDIKFYLILIAPCYDPNPSCENDSKCKWDMTMNNDYECICKPGFTGQYCSQCKKKNFFILK
jgi:hypothetical protein